MPEQSIRDKLLAKVESQRLQRSKKINKKVRKLETYNVSEMARNMVKDKKGGISNPKLMSKYLQLYQDHPSLYNLIIKRDNFPEEELAILDKMLELREQLRDGDLTEEQALDQAATSALEVRQPSLLKPSNLPAPEQDYTYTEL